MGVSGSTIHGKYSESPLSDALHRLNLEGAGDNIRRKMMETAVDVIYKESKARAPVKTGELKGAIYKTIEETKYLIHGRVAISKKIKYAFAVIFGDKRHKPNRFLEISLKGGIAYIMARFKSIAKESFAEARGKK